MMASPNTSTNKNAALIYSRNLRIDKLYSTFEAISYLGQYITKTLN